ncbi:hypothetical protein L7F22_007299 [Adiantum nelumboides]|nr:hypothetical protein [Adiantum nelumboides]
MTSKAKDKQCAEMFGDNKKMILHVRKEAYWEAILTQGKAIIYDMQIQGEELPDEFGKFVKEQRSLHIGWIQRLIGQGFLNTEPDLIKDWIDMHGRDSICPPSWIKRGVTQLALERCPWWLDYPLGRVPPSESELWEGGSLYHAAILLRDIQTFQDDHAPIDTFLEKISQKTLRIGEPCKTVARMVWADFPFGLAVSQVGNLECPPWNVFDGDVLHAATQFADNYANEGWIAHQPSKFVIVHLVKYQHAPSLEKAISKKAKWYELYALPLGSLIASGTVQPITLREVTFGVWAFFSQEEKFTNHSSIKESLFQPMSTLGIDDEEELDALTTAKSFFVRPTIKCICFKEDDKVVDIVSIGYETKEALLQQGKVISVACTNEHMTELEALCHSTIDEDDDLKRWVGLVSTPQNDNGKDSENEEIDELLDALADAILELLQEIG